MIGKTGNAMTEDGWTPADEVFVTCPTCEGEKTVECDVCHGSGMFCGESCIECKEGKRKCGRCEGEGDVSGIDLSM